MRHILSCFIVAFFLISAIVNGQTDVTVRRKDFKTDKSGFSEAWKHVKDGDAYFDQKGIWYNNALDEYLQALIYNSSNAELNYKAGISALFSDKKEDAAGFLLKALELKKNVSDDILLFAGRSLQFSGKYSEAIEKLNTYIDSAFRKSKNNLLLAKEYLEQCKSAQAVIKDTLRILIENPGSAINSDADDYSEILSSDGNTMYFASRREISSSGKRHPDSKFDENIFISTLSNGLWMPSVSAGKDINTKYCETPLYISRNGDQLYIYNGYSNNGDIKVSNLKNGKWRSPKTVPFNINTRGAETSFTISPSGNEIYYVSDRGKGNIGGKDIYFIQKISDRKWSKPKNAGSIINTPYDEESVRFSKAGDTLWFSSRGHNSIGGFDIFYTIKNKSGEWDSVKNAGYPINTSWDEIFYYPSPVKDSTFYFASNRSGGFGGLDIYQGKILPPVRIVIPPAPPKKDSVVVKDTVVVAPAPVIPPVYLTGNVRDSESGTSVLAKIDAMDISTGEAVGTTASSEIDGSYKMKLPVRKSYMIYLHATGYLSDTRRADIPDNWPDTTFTLNLQMIKVKVGKKVVLNNILFETGKAVIAQSSFIELDHLVNIMKDNEEMRIEISGHTDNTGSELLNQKLSQSRAKAVVDYLVQNGIAQSRVEFKGYGSTQPIDNNATVQGRAKNRRVEFKILEF